MVKATAGVISDRAHGHVLPPLYEAACRALERAKSVDEVKNIHDKSVAMKAYARQAKDRDLEANAVAIRMRATRRLGQLIQAQKEKVGLATGGEHGGRKRKDGVRNTPSNVHATLASQGIDKNLAKEARKLAAPSEKEFEQKVAEVRDATARAEHTVMRSITIDHTRHEQALSGEYVTLKTHLGEEVRYPLPKSTRFVRTNDQVSWAAWTWNPVTGCLHGCRYCYAREIAEKKGRTYPVGFTPLFHLT